MLDQIIQFAGVGQYIDQPVQTLLQRYVHAPGIFRGRNIEPESLLVDEVLAVGDADFQKKCLQAR